MLNQHSTIWNAYRPTGFSQLIGKRG